MKTECRGKGHKLKEIVSVVAFQCTRKDCEYYKNLRDISGGFGRFCDKCEASGEYVDAAFSGSEYVAYKCKSCGHTWRNLR